MIGSGTALAVGAVALVALVVLAILLGARRRRAPALPVHARPVLTDYEISFYRRLVAALERIGGVDVFPQVAMGAVMDADRGLSAEARRAVRNRFDRKIIDFVVVDARTNVLLIVELDDRTHDAAKDRQRDAITAAAGHATLRIRGKDARDDREIERQLRLHLSHRPS